MSQLQGADSVMGGDEEALFGEAIYDYQNGQVVIRRWELFNEAMEMDSHGWGGIGSCLSSL